MVKLSKTFLVSRTKLNWKFKFKYKLVESLGVTNKILSRFQYFITLNLKITYIKHR